MAQHADPICLKVRRSRLQWAEQTAGEVGFSCCSCTWQHIIALQVKHPSRLVASEFGNLREDNLQLILVARRITDKIVTIR